MKKIFSIFTSLLLLAGVTSCDMFKLDNVDGPDAEVTGRLIDAKTGENIPLQVGSTSVWDWGSWSMKTTYVGTMIVIEQGWEAIEDQAWLPRFCGDYTNKMVFAGDYVLTTKSLPVYLEQIPFTLKKGKNTQDFSLTPYARVIDPKFSYDAATKKIKATFKVELGDNTKANTIQSVALCAYTDRFVSYDFNLCKNDPSSQKQNQWWTGVVLNENEEITLEIDTTLGANVEEFKYTRPHYLRIAVLANGNGQNSAGAYNYSQTYKMSADFQTVEKVEWPAED